MKKKFLISLLIVSMLLLAAPSAIFADDGESSPGEPPTEEPAPAAESAPNVGAQCEGVDCDVLPEQEEEPVGATYTVDAAIPGSGNAAMTGDVKVDGEVFQNVEAVCGNEEDVIYIGVDTPMSIGLATNASILNAIASEYGFAGYTDEEAYIRGSQIDDAMELAVSTGDYTEVIRLVRDATQDIPDATIVWVGGDDQIRSYWAIPNDSESIQSLLMWIEECVKQGKDPRHEKPPMAIKNIDTGGGTTIF